MTLQSNKSAPLIVLMAWHEEKDPAKIKCFEANKKTFVDSNPDIDIITVINPFEDSKVAWLSTDLSVFSWYQEHKETFIAERYLIVEWDCWCDVNLVGHYQRVWDLDVVGPVVKYPERDSWGWFNSIKRLPAKARCYATGIVPFCGIMISKKAMDDILEEILKPEYDGLNSELRLPTIATMLGYHPVTNPKVNRIITWKEPVPFDERIKGLHHPRKRLDDSSDLQKIEKFFNYSKNDLPKIFHQTWADEKLPESMAVLAETWREHHPEWQYLLWTDQMNRAFIKTYFPDFLLQYDSYEKNIQRVDAVRYFILYKIGGIFIDTDFECLMNIEPLLKNNDCMFGLEPQAHCDQFKKDKIICNAFMAVKPGHDFFRTICESLTHINAFGNGHIDHILSTTGPFALTAIYDSYERKECVTLLPSSTIYPLTVKEAHQAMVEDLDDDLQYKIDEAYAVHYFFGTWY